MLLSLTAIEGVVIALDATRGQTAPAKAPKDFRIFSSGKNPATKGVFLFDEKAATSVMAMYDAMGRRVTFDYDHGALLKGSPNPSETAKSSGSCQLEIRQGALWAFDVRWTPKAKQAIEDEEWLYFSPAFDKDKDGRPTWLINVALTNNPSLYDLNELQEQLRVAAGAILANVLLSDTTTDGVNHDPAMRREAARKSASTWASNNFGVYGPTGSPPDHPSVTAPLSGTYPNPAAYGGWMGWIEPKDGTWITFVAQDGKCALWEARNPDGTVVGAPRLFARDLATFTDAAQEKPMPRDPKKDTGGDALPEAANTASMPLVAPPGAPVVSRGDRGPFAGNDVQAAQAALVDAEARARKARETALAWANGNVVSYPSTAQSPAAAPHTYGDCLTAPLTWRYPDPEAVGGWLGAIEPANGEWIAFVATDGRMLLWQQREANGGVIGLPVALWRDVATLSATLDTITLHAVPAAGAVALDMFAAGDPVQIDRYDYQRRNAREQADTALANPALKVGKTAPDHPAATAPLTGRYSDPLSTPSRWLGWIEPTNREWIAFVSMDGRALLWPKRETGAPYGRVGTGIGIGDPIVFMREITTLSIDAPAKTPLPPTSTPRGEWAEASAVAPPSKPTITGAVNFRGYPVNDTASWDGDAATHRLRIWASSDGSGDSGTIDWDRYARAFAYVDPTKVGTFAGYKLPHHDVEHGELTTNKRGVQAAAAMLSKSEIPEAEAPAVREHLAQHYHQWGAKAPWEQPTQATTKEPSAMHLKLSGFMKSKSLTAAAVKAKLLKANPDLSAEECDALMGDDHDKASAASVKKMSAALDAIADEAPESSKRNPFAKDKGEKANVAALSALGVAFGLNADAEPDTVVRVLAMTGQNVRELCSALGTSSVAGLIGKVEALKIEANEGKAAVQKLNALEAATVKTAALSAITTAAKENRLTPAKEQKARGYLEAGKYETLSAFLEGCDTVVAGFNGAAPTQLSTEQLAAVHAAGGLPGAAAPGAGAGGPGQPTGGSGGDPTMLSLDTIMASADFKDAAKALGITSNATELRAFGIQMLADAKGVPTSEIAASYAAEADKVRNGARA